MSILTELARRVGSRRFAHDILHGRSTTEPWWQLPLADGLRDVSNEQLSPEKAKAVADELAKVLRKDKDNPQ